MSFFGVTIEKISKVWPHTNADSLDLASLEGMSYQFVVGKGSTQPGDYVIYFPIDSVLSPEVVEALPPAVARKLAGSAKNRIRTTRLRGEISQGLALRIEEFPFIKFGLVINSGKIHTILGEDLGNDVTKPLKVEKYEPPVVFESRGVKLVQLPPESPVYDIEGADRNPQIIDLLRNELVMISEKLEGTSFSIVGYPDGAVKVCQRNFEIQLEPDGANKYHLAANETGLWFKARDMAAKFNAPVTIRGELCGPGIQGNHYSLPKLEIYCFDIQVGGKYLDAVEWKQLCEDWKILTVPLVYGGPLENFLYNKTVQQASEGESLLKSGVLREGIVIKPAKEMPYIMNFGRCFIKQRSPAYLAKYDR